MPSKQEIRVLKVYNLKNVILAILTKYIKFTNSQTIKSNPDLISSPELKTTINHLNITRNRG